MLRPELDERRYGSSYDALLNGVARGLEDLFPPIGPARPGGAEHGDGADGRPAMPDAGGRDTTGHASGDAEKALAPTSVSRRTGARPARLGGTVPGRVGGRGPDLRTEAVRQSG